VSGSKLLRIDTFLVRHILLRTCRKEAAMEYYNIGVDLLTNPKRSRWVIDSLLVGETVLCALIIWKVPCKQNES
jgi:hypothetical protein